LKEYTLRVVSGNFCEVLTGKFETTDVFVSLCIETAIKICNKNAKAIKKNIQSFD